MLKKSFFCSLFLFLSSPFCIGQNTMVGGVAASGLDMNTAFGGFISEIDMTNYDPIGNVYLNEEWQKASVILKNNKSIGDLDIKINLLKNTVDIKTKEAVRVFSLQNIKQIDLKVLSDSTARYYNPFEFQFYDNTPVTGLLRLETENYNQWNVVERTFLKIYEASYVKALDAGVKNDRYSVDKEFYLVKESVLYPIIANRKKFVDALSLGERQSDELFQFLKSNKINLKSHQSLPILLDFLNK